MADAKFVRIHRHGKRGTCPGNVLIVVVVLLLEIGSEKVDVSKKVKRKNISSGPLIVLKINNESVKST